MARHKVWRKVDAYSLDISPLLSQSRLIGTLRMLAQPLKRLAHCRPHRVPFIRFRKLLQRLVVALRVEQALETVQIPFEGVARFFSGMAGVFKGGDRVEAV